MFRGDHQNVVLVPKAGPVLYCHTMIRAKRCSKYCNGCRFQRDSPDTCRLLLGRQLPCMRREIQRRRLLARHCRGDRLRIFSPGVLPLLARCRLSCGLLCGHWGSGFQRQHSPMRQLRRQLRGGCWRLLRSSWLLRLIWLPRQQRPMHCTGVHCISAAFIAPPASQYSKYLFDYSRHLPQEGALNQMMYLAVSQERKHTERKTKGAPQ